VEASLIAFLGTKWKKKVFSCQDDNGKCQDCNAFISTIVMYLFTWKNDCRKTENYWKGYLVSKLKFRIICWCLVGWRGTLNKNFSSKQHVKTKTEFLKYWILPESQKTFVVFFKYRNFARHLINQKSKMIILEQSFETKSWTFPMLRWVPYGIISYALCLNLQFLELIG
jgi:hypothetical protein